MSFLLPALVLAASIVATPASAVDAATKAGAATPAARKTTTPAQKTRRYPVGGLPASARQLYALNWGVDKLSAQLAESGQLVRFSYRVLDTGKAKALHEKAATPYLVDEKANVVLQVPDMEKVGPLRQAGQPPEYGKSYWMVFSNKGNIVRPGHRVSIVIGQFRVDGLIVQ